MAPKRKRTSEFGPKVHRAPRGGSSDPETPSPKRPRKEQDDDHNDKRPLLPRGPASRGKILMKAAAHHIKTVTAKAIGSAMGLAQLHPPPANSKRPAVSDEDDIEDFEDDEQENRKSAVRPAQSTKPSRSGLDAATRALTGTPQPQRKLTSNGFRTSSERAMQKWSPALNRTTPQRLSFSPLSARNAGFGPSPLSQRRITNFFAQSGSSTGVRNLGNSCYMGSALQALRGILCFATDMEAPRLMEHDGLLESVHHAVQQIVGSHTLADPSEVMAAMKDVRFNKYQQQDVHEFVLALFEQINREVEFCFGEEMNSICPVTLNFATEIEQRRTCQECQAPTEPYVEAFVDMSLDVPTDGSTLTVQDLLAHFFEDSEVEYKCDCGGTHSKIHREISKLPRVLMIQLRRFEFRGTRAVKIDEAVQILPEIDLGRFVSEELAVATKPQHMHLARRRRASLASGGASAAQAAAGSKSQMMDLTRTADDVFDEEMQRALEESRKEAHIARIDLATTQELTEASPSLEIVQVVEKSKRAPPIPKESKRESDDIIFSEEAEDVKEAAAEKEEKDLYAEPEPVPLDHATKYKLVSVVNHLGATASSGHYVSYVRDVLKSKWRYYNDSQSFEQREEQVLQKSQRNSYLLFYVQNDCLS
eukprot:m.7064 g.7064  ORF g.7064 m.7064 type:complete len:647 (-) comp2703_c0_seq1:28-1968(-)